MTRKEAGYSQEFNYYIAEEVGNVLTAATIDNRLPAEVYVLITRHDGQRDRIFMAPYAMNYARPGIAQDVAMPHKLEETGVLIDEIPLVEHLQEVVKAHPDVGLVLDNKTAITLTGTNPRLTLVDNGNNHCMLLGLRETPVDTFLTGDHFQMGSNPSIFI